MNFCQSYTQKEYKALARDARIKLFNLQQQCMTQKVPVIIYVDGVSGTGKGSFVNLLSEWCDVKHLKTIVSGFLLTKKDFVRKPGNIG